MTRQETGLVKQLRAQGWRAASGGLAKALWETVLYRRFHEIPKLCHMAIASDVHPIALVEKISALSLQFGFHDDFAYVAASRRLESPIIASLETGGDRASAAAHQVLYGNGEIPDGLRSRWITAASRAGPSSASANGGPVHPELYSGVDWPSLTADRVLLETFAIPNVGSLLASACPSVCAKTAFARFIIEAHDGGLHGACETLIEQGLFDAVPLSHWRMGVTALARREAIPLSIALARAPRGFPSTCYDASQKALVLTEKGADLSELTVALSGGTELITVPVNHADLSRIPAEARPIQPTQLVEHYSDEESALAERVAVLANDALNAWQTVFSRAVPEYAEWNAYFESMYVRLFMVMYQIEINRAAIDKMLSTSSTFDRLILLCSNGDLLIPYTTNILNRWGPDSIVISLVAVEPARVADVLDRILAAAAGLNVDDTDLIKAPSDDWPSELAAWMREVAEYSPAPVSGQRRRWVAAFFQQINGYLDSYKNLLSETLNRADVEVVTSTANQVLNRLIEAGEIENSNGPNSVKRLILHSKAAPPAKWLSSFMTEVDADLSFLASNSATAIRQEHLREIRAVFRRTPMILQSAAYFSTRFTDHPPEHVITAPNQHIEARIASYVGRRLGIPVYDVLILAVTNHPRYRPPICDRIFVYDPWYSDLYKEYFGVREDQILVSGPLFDYGAQIRAASAGHQEGGLIVFFSQNAYLNLCLRVVDGIFRAMGRGSNLRLIIKLHPHESPTNASLYMDAARRCGLEGVTEVIVSGDHLQLIRKSDVVVQMFSNVGLDAFLMRKPVITARFSRPSKIRLFFHEKGIGQEVSDEDELADKLYGLLYDEKARRELVERADAFVAANGHFLAVNNAGAAVATMFDLTETLRAQRS